MPAMTSAIARAILSSASGDAMYEDGLALVLDGLALRRR
jgi:hypothetical protein